MMQLEVENNLVRWTESFMSRRKVRLVLISQEETDHDVNTGITQGSPVSRVLFTIYLSGLFAPVEDKVSGIKALSFVDDVAWLAEGEREAVLSATLQKQAWAEANAVIFDTRKREAITLSGRRRSRW